MMNSKGCGFGLSEALLWNFPGGTEENQEEHDSG
jgi:hypothetical protein